MEPTIVFQILVTIGIAMATIGLIYWYRKLEHENRQKIREEYQRQLDLLSEYPDNVSIRAECYRLGDLYFTDRLPDIYSYPLPNYGLYVESIDNSKERKRLVERDIEDRIAKSGGTYVHHKQAA